MLMMVVMMVVVELLVDRGSIVVGSFPVGISVVVYDVCGDRGGVGVMVVFGRCC